MKKLIICLIIFKRILSWLLLTVLVGLGLVIAVSFFNLPGGIKLYTVMSGSMEPTIGLGSLILVKGQPGYQPGDIITYKLAEDANNPRPKVTATHRIFAIKDNIGQLEFVTKGDANDQPDSGPVRADLIIGKVIAHLPYLGRAAAFAKTKEGFILAVIIPATLIIYSEILNIKNEIKKLRRKHG